MGYGPMSTTDIRIFPLTANCRRRFAFCNSGHRDDSWRMAERYRHRKDHN